MVQLKTREYSIVCYLLKQKNPVTASQLAKVFSISLRMIRYDLVGIENALKPKGIQLKKKNNVGYWFDNPDEVRKELNIVIENVDESKWRVLSQEERCKKIVSILLSNNSFITVEKIADMIDVSSSTVKRDMLDVEKWFLSKKISIDKRQKVGVKISCDEKIRRNAMMDFIEENNKNINLPYLLEKKPKINSFDDINSGFVNNFIRTLFNEIDVKQFQNVIVDVGKELNVTYSNQAINTLIIHFGIARNRLRSGQIIVMDPDKLKEIKKTKEYKCIFKRIGLLEKIYDIKIPESEIGFMSLHLIGAKLTDIGGSKPNKEEIKIVDDYIKRVGELLGVDFRKDEILRKNLWIHIKPTLYRLKNDLKITNPILNQIKAKYSKIYGASRIAANEMGKRLNVEVIDDEVGFMAIHIGASLERSKQKNKKKIKVLVACGTSLGTAKILSSRLNREFSEIEIVDEVAVYDVEKHIDSNIDLIISTVQIQNVLLKPVIVVSPLLEENDVEFIKTAIKRINHIDIVETPKDENTVDQLIEIINQFGSVNDVDGLKQAIQILLEKRNIIENAEDEYMLSEMICKETIKIGYKAKDKNDAIRTAGELLVNAGYAKNSYVDGMIELSDELNAYIVIAPGIAMPHARPEKGAIKSGFGFLILDEPIVFGHPTNDPVKVVIPLCAVDNSSHLRALSELASILDNDESSEALKGAKSINEVMEIILNFEKNHC